MDTSFEVQPLEESVVEIVLPKTPQKCAQCDYTTTGTFNLKRHIMKKHDKDTGGREQPMHYREFLCDECGLQYNSAFALARHKRCTHDPSLVNFICPTCGREYKRQDNFCRHLTTHTNPTHLAGTKTVQCTYEGCEKRFSKQWCMNRHIAGVHHRQTFTCHACNKRYKSKSALAYHVNHSH
ncbi:hypothetical protein BaRGS_00000880 [Batillaria attramentaria]|uniref:C2H2-type domain-containing protein n=1 Tax=Batillaria attramentaria TaxID=370345 RepID=A0ABD0M8R7_9CAEN